MVIMNREFRENYLFVSREIDSIDTVNQVFTSALLMRSVH